MSVTCLLSASLSVTYLTHLHSLALFLSLSFPANSTSGDAGDYVLMTITITSTATCTSPAYDIDIFAASPSSSFVLLQPGSGTTTTSIGTIVEGTGSSDTQVHVSIPVLMPGQNAIVRFVSQVRQSVRSAVKFTDAMSVQWWR